MKKNPVRSQPDSVPSVHVVAVIAEATVTAQVTGEADLASASQLEAGLAAALGDHPHATVVVDLAGLAFMDCAGAEALLRGLAFVSAGRRPITVRNANRLVRIVLNVVHDDRRGKTPATIVVNEYRGIDPGDIEYRPLEPGKPPEARPGTKGGAKRSYLGTVELRLADDRVIRLRLVVDDPARPDWHATTDTHAGSGAVVGAIRIAASGQAWVTLLDPPCCGLSAQAEVRITPTGAPLLSGHHPFSVRSLLAAL